MFVASAHRASLESAPDSHPNAQACALGTPGFVGVENRVFRRVCWRWRRRLEWFEGQPRIVSV